MSAFQIRHHHNLAPRAKRVERKVRSQPLKKKKQVYHPVSSVKCARSPEKKKSKKKSKIYHPMSTAKCTSSP